MSLARPEIKGYLYKGDCPRFDAKLVNWFCTNVPCSIKTHRRHRNSGKTNGASEGDGNCLLDWVDVLKLLGSRR